jgi:glutamine amidotransferase
MFKDLRPAWNDPNLRDLSSHIQSSLFLAHVRATTGTEIQRSNCHPFREGRWLFMHNGAIAEFSRLKRELVLAIDEELFPCIRGTTDTEIMFLLALTFGLDSDPVTAVEHMVGFVELVAERQGVADAMQMTVCLSNGDSLYAFRYATRGTPRSLYVNVDLDCLCELDVEPSIFEPHAKVIVSEPFGGLSDNWEEIAPSSLIVVDDGAIHRRPFEPKV